MEPHDYYQHNRHRRCLAQPHVPAEYGQAPHRRERRHRSQTIIFGVAGAVVALIVAVTVLGNLDTATQGTINESSAYYALLETINVYGSTSITLLAIGVIVAGAAAILFIIRGSF